jgi:3-dehydrosphinganine reductase
MSSLSEVCLSWPYFAAIPGGIVLLLTIYSYLMVESAPSFPFSSSTHVFITGGSSGIGLSCALELVKRGVGKLTIVGRDRNKLNEAVKIIEKSIRESKHTIRKDDYHVTAIAADVSDPAAIESAINQAIDIHGPINALSASAGISKPGYFELLNLSEFQEMFKINYFGTLNTLKALLPHMRANGGGRVLLVSSMAGQSGVAGYSAHSPPKFALRGLAECLHMEYKPYNIQFTVVNPPDVDTPMLEQENKIKPLECKLISEGTGVFKSQEIARDIVNSLESWKFFVQTGFDGHLLGLLSCGTAPAHSTVLAVTEALFLGLIRSISLAYRVVYNRIVIKVHKDRMAGKLPHVLKQGKEEKKD